MRALAAFILAAATPALAAAQAGPHTSAEDYTALRGGFGPATEIAWSVTRGPLEGGETQTNQRRMLAGDGWALDDPEGGAATLHDFALQRTVEFDGDAYTNSATHAHARHNLDIYIQLSQRGEAETIDFGAAGTFDRFWLEAAMGVSAAGADLETETSPETIIWRRGGEDIARAEFGDCYGETLDPALAASLIAGLRQAAPIHPDIGSALAERGEAPCTLAFTIYSPDSPDGRREVWTVGGATPDEDPAIFPEGAGPVLPQAPFLNDLAGPAALAVFGPDADPAPGPLDFMGFVQEAREEGDLAGALLLTVRETHHFGPCPTETIGTARMACVTVNDLAQAGIGNAAFEQVLEALNQMQAGNHAQAVANMKPFAARDDRAGAAARTITANELVAWGEAGLAAHPDLDPARLLAEAVAIDPLAPDSYWHLGRRYLAAGSPEAAWALFDLGRALPGRETTPLLEQATALEEGIEQLAPGYFALEAGPTPSRQVSPEDRAAAPAAERASPERAPSAVTGSHAVQIGAFGSREEAERAWLGFVMGAPDLADGRQHEIVEADLGEGATVYRLRIAGFETRDAARTYCATLADRGQDCLVAD